MHDWRRKRHARLRRANVTQMKSCGETTSLSLVSACTCVPCVASVTLLRKPRPATAGTAPRSTLMRSSPTWARCAQHARNASGHTIDYCVHQLRALPARMLTWRHSLKRSITPLPMVERRHVQSCLSRVRCISIHVFLRARKKYIAPRKSVGNISHAGFATRDIFPMVVFWK